MWRVWERCAQGVGGEAWGKEPLGRPRRRLEYNIKMDLQEVGGGLGNWMERAQDRDRHMLLLDSCLQTCMTYTIAECTVNKLLMMDRGTVRKMYSFMPKQICEISAPSWFYYKEKRKAPTLTSLRNWCRISKRLWKNKYTYNTQNIILISC
jgi:hypothetical protein